MKNLILVIILLLISGCSTKVISDSNKNNKQTKILFEEDLEQRLGIYGQVYKLSSINPEFKKHNLRYKMLIVDSRVWEKNREKILATRSIIKQFGKQLGNKAIVYNLILKTSEKRSFFNDIQNNIGTYFNPDKDAPFLIFYRPNSLSKKYVPYEIVSLASISPQYLHQKLSLLGNAIEKGQSKREIHLSLNKIKNNLYVKKGSDKVKKIINIFMEWFL